MVRVDTKKFHLSRDWEVRGAMRFHGAIWGKKVCAVLTFGTDALVVMFAELMARASVFTRRRIAGDVVALAVLPGVSARAHTSAKRKHI